MSFLGFGKNSLKEDYEAVGSKALWDEYYDWSKNCYGTNYPTEEKKDSIILDKRDVNTDGYLYGLKIMMDKIKWQEWERENWCYFRFSLFE